MLEIERKILGINKRAITTKLRELGAKKLFNGLVRVKYFDHHDGRIREKRDLLRVREFIERGKPSYTEIVYKSFKGVRDGNKVLEETELKLSGKQSFDTLCLLLSKIGFKQTAYYEKKREIYSLKKWKFEFDKYPKIPEFLEIEAQSGKDIEVAIKFLELEKHEQTADAISRFIKKRYPKLSLDGLVF